MDFEPPKHIEIDYEEREFYVKTHVTILRCVLSDFTQNDL